MVCLGLEPGAAVWKAQTNPQSYGQHPIAIKMLIRAGEIAMILIMELNTGKLLRFHHNCFNSIRRLQFCELLETALAASALKLHCR